MENNNIINNLKNNIKNDKKSFYCNGSIELIDNKLKIFFIDKEKKTNHIILPHEIQSKIKLLINSSEVAKFGQGDKTVEDVSYRYAYQMCPEIFSLDNKLDIYKMGILNEIQQILKYDVNVKDIYADLYCLNIYEKKSFFKSHIDTPKSDKMFGSLVISLPSNFTGGILKIKHNNESKEFDLSINNNTEIKWVAFYSDCEHEISEVFSGYRITLTYNLYIRENKNYEEQYKYIDVTKIELYNTLKTIKENENTIKKLGFIMEHKYPNLIKFSENTNFIKILKGLDLKLFLICKKLNLEINFKGIIDIKDYVEYYSEDYKISKIIKDVFFQEYYDSDSENSYDSIYSNNNTIPDNILLTTNDLTVNGGGQYCDEGYNDIKDFLENVKLSGAEYDKDITWITKPKNWIQSTSYMTYGNEAETKYHYVTGAFVIDIENSKNNN